MTQDNNKLNNIHLLAFDADDTLWDCQGHFDDVESAYCKLLSDYGTGEEISASLFKTESSNMPVLGYGSKAFTISLIENAIKVSKGKADNKMLMKIIDLGKTLLNLPATPLEGVATTLRQIRQKDKYKMVVFTKGDNLDQENKFNRSGLQEFFDDIVVVADKTRREYTRLCNLFDTDISQVCMVGNSYKSDILPVLQLGGYAIHIPYNLMWKMEKTEEEHEHPHLRRIDKFNQLVNLL